MANPTKPTIKPEPKPEPIPETTPETPQITGPETTTSSGSASHLDDIEVDDPGASDPLAEYGPEVQTKLGNDHLLSLEAFKENYLSLMILMGNAAGVEALMTVAERPTTDPGLRALYETCHDVKALHFMLKPGNVWIERGLAIGAFVVPLARDVGIEVRAKRAAKSGDMPDAQPAPDAGAAEPVQPVSRGEGPAYNPGEAP